MSVNNIATRFGTISQVRTWSASFVGASHRGNLDTFFPTEGWVKTYSWEPDSTRAPIWQMALILAKADELGLIERAVLKLQEDDAFFHQETKYHVAEFALYAMQHPLAVIHAIKYAQENTPQ